MAARAALEQLLSRQKEELEKHSADYVRYEEELEVHKNSANYEQLDTAGKAQYTRKLNEITKNRNASMDDIALAHKRIATTSLLLPISQGNSQDSSRGESSSGRNNSRVPVLPKFRGTSRDSIQDPFDFIDQCDSLFEAHYVPVERWVTVLLTALSASDRQWAKQHIVGKEWEEAKRLFLAHFESPLLKENLLAELMSIAIRPKENVQQYGDRFLNLMRRTGRTDSDETLIPVFIKGLDYELQNMMYISRVTEYTARSEQSPRPEASVDREVKRAITLGAGRRKPDQNRTIPSNPNGGRKNGGYKQPNKPGGEIPSAHPKEDKNSDNKNGKEVDSPPSFRKKKCFKCKKPGWTRQHVCDPKDIPPKENNNMEVEPEPFTDDGRSFADKLMEEILTPEISVISTTPDGGNLIFTPVSINGFSELALVDSGADASYVSKEFVQKHDIPINPMKGIIRGGNGERMEDRIGTVTVVVENGANKLQCELEVTQLSKDRAMVIGLPQFAAFGFRIEGVPVKLPEPEKEPGEEISPPGTNVEPSNEPSTISNEVHELCQENKSITLSTRCSHPLAELHLNLKDKNPIWKNINYVSPRDDTFVTKRVEEMMACRVIENAPDDCLNAFPLVVVPKKDAYGRKIDRRLCLDLRPLNPRIQDIDYPIPRINDVIDAIGSVQGEKTIYTTIDIRDGYHRFNIPDEERNWIAFRWNRKHYRYTCAPFGIKTMTSLFQRVMDKMFGDLPYVAVYVDDITIFSLDPGTHAQHVAEVIRRLNFWKLPIRFDKSHFGMKRVKLLGYIVSGKGVEKDPEKVKCFANWPQPKTGKQIMRFLGAANFYRHFIRDFSIISKPLDKARSVKGQLEWNSEMSESFEKIKEEVLKHAVLTHPNMDKKFIVGTDASKSGLGAWIGQYHDDTLKIIEFASRSLSKSEVNYSPSKLELLGIIFAIKKFHSYCVRGKFELRTDHRALIYLFTQTHPNDMIIGWFDKLNALEFDVVHVKGEDNNMADALSRMNEPKSFSNMVLETFLRDKKNPGNAAACIDMIERAHRFGHFGEKSVFKRIWEDGYWWPNMRQQIRDNLAGCAPCLRYNVGKRGFHPLRSIEASMPWDHLAVDLVTPLPMSNDGYDTLLVIVDMMTKFAILKPLKGKEMVGVARATWEVLALFGIPKIIQSDNGSEFVNQMIEELVRLNGIDHRTISAYNPRANGQVERTNQTVENLLCKELQGAMHQWVEFIPYVQLAYNANVSATTGSTPFALMFGRSLNEFKKYGKSVSSELNIELWKVKQSQIVDSVYPAITERVQKKKGRTAEQYIRNKNIISPDTFPPGASVMMYDKTRESKWDAKYEGPFTVIRRNRGGAYVLKDRLGETLKRTVPSDQLKLVIRKGLETGVEDDNSLLIKKILSHRTVRNGYEYLIEWANKDVESSWEPVENFDDVAVIKKYWTSIRPTRKKKKSNH